MFGEILVMCGACCVGRDLNLKPGRRAVGDGVRFLRARLLIDLGWLTGSGGVGD
jgi:hypothetical protein